jgi:iron-sulfur cluster assembly accessory protein
LPPRNADIPESSIASSIPQVNDIRPPDLSRAQEGLKKSSSSQTETISEAEAQKSKPISSAASTPTTSSEPVAKPKRSRLRARKAAINLTPAAITHLRRLLEQPDPKLIRIGVKNKGCSGLAYHLEYVDKAGQFDETVEAEGVKVLIDSKALFSIIGSEMDWVEDKLSARFVFTNPNISKLWQLCIFIGNLTNYATEEQCGCGESFMV